MEGREKLDMRSEGPLTVRTVFWAYLRSSRTNQSQLPRFVSQDDGSGSAFSCVPPCDVILEGSEQIVHGRRYSKPAFKLAFIALGTLEVIRYRKTKRQGGFLCHISSLRRRRTYFTAISAMAGSRNDRVYCSGHSGGTDVGRKECGVRQWQTRVLPLLDIRLTDVRQVRPHVLPRKTLPHSMVNLSYTEDGRKPSVHISLRGCWAPPRMGGGSAKFPNRNWLVI